MWARAVHTLPRPPHGQAQPRRGEAASSHRTTRPCPSGSSPAAEARQQVRVGVGQGGRARTRDRAARWARTIATCRARTCRRCAWAATMRASSQDRSLRRMGPWRHLGRIHCRTRMVNRAFTTPTSTAGLQEGAQGSTIATRPSAQRQAMAVMAATSAEALSSRSSLSRATRRRHSEARHCPIRRRHRRCVAPTAQRLRTLR